MAPSFFAKLRQREIGRRLERHTREGIARDAKRADAQGRRAWLLAQLALVQKTDNLTAMQELCASALAVQGELEALDREDIVANDKLIEYLNKSHGEK